MTDWSPAGLNAALNGGLQAAGTWISLHSSAPGTTGAAEISGGSYSRVSTTWGSDSGGAVTGSQVNINVPAGGVIEYFGVWSAQTGGTYLYGAALPNNESYTGAGVYQCTPTVTATGTS